MRTAKRFKVSSAAAKDKKIPRSFVGVVVRWTDRAVLVFGRGTTEGHVSCMLCGRPLTHPVSKILGVGPECGRHWWDESELGPYGFTEAHAQRLSAMVKAVQFRVWLRMRDVEWEETGEPFELPPDLSAEAAEGEPPHPPPRLRPPSAARPQDPLRPRHPQDGVPERRGVVGGEPRELRLYFPYDASLVAEVKRFRPARFVRHPEPHWIVSADAASIAKARALGFQIS